MTRRFFTWLGWCAAPTWPSAWADEMPGMRRFLFSRRNARAHRLAFWLSLSPQFRRLDV
jgi:hypothetical protein